MDRIETAWLVHMPIKFACVSKINLMPLFRRVAGPVLFKRLLPVAGDQGDFDVGQCRG
ncbi:MAG: hypothetical protein KDJ62_05720 [Rhodobiaceae bacterium]|nr:hypothetical protein [Rhodobiaceae bacterium]MCC0049642.1 hypothetical protein [Rhodobiaceae bacterium]